MMGYTQERRGKHVTYTDPVGKKHDALVTADWSTDTYPQGSLNVVWVSDDESKSDPYGQQLERATSVPHKSNQSAHGSYWE